MVFLPTEAFKMIIDYAGHNYQQKHKQMMQGVIDDLISMPKDWLADAMECGWFYEEHEIDDSSINQLWDEYIKPQHWEFHNDLEGAMELLSDWEGHEMSLLEYRNFFHKPEIKVPAFWVEDPSQHGFGSVVKYYKSVEEERKINNLKNRIKTIMGEILVEGIFINSNKLERLQNELDSLKVSSPP